MASAAATNGPHAAGIFADMTVDGPEIGTVIIICDRAKNLPNKKMMGKQNPYCAARLGKEAKRTHTVERGGQTPRWDKELRFTVHDSPDYYNLKLSIFSEDKRNDLVGEAWIDLHDVIVHGGGTRDFWQTLMCKGKYAGEIRVEITFWDSRQKPDKGPKVVSMAEELRRQYGTVGKVKRKPVVQPSNPNAPVTTDVVIPDRPLPGRAKHGPREYQAQSRATSLPPETLTYPHSAASLMLSNPSLGQLPNHSATVLEHIPQDLEPEEAGIPAHLSQSFSNSADPSLASYPAPMPDLSAQLPQISAVPGHRASLPPPMSTGSGQRYASYPTPQPLQQQPPQHAMQHPASLRPHSYHPMPHYNSAPSIPTLPAEEYHHVENHPGYQHQPEPSFPGEQHYQRHHPEPQYQQQSRMSQARHSDISISHEAEYAHELHAEPAGAYEVQELESPPPPPPPMHSHSAPTLPNYGTPHRIPSPPVAAYAPTPPSIRQQHYGAAERGYAPPQQPADRMPRGRTLDNYPHHSTDNSPLYSTGHTPNGSVGHSPSPYGKTTPSRQALNRHSIADPYTTPPHPYGRDGFAAPNHRAAQRPSVSPAAGDSMYSHEHPPREPAPLIKPRAVSPAPSPAPAAPRFQPKNSYSIQHPIRAFESSEDNPLSTSRPATIPSPHSAPPLRKSVSPHPAARNPSASHNTTPFSPDDFDIHNPNSTSPSAADLSNPSSRTKIIGFHGQEIDPSDHLPVETWAPEPERKGGPPKIYGVGRDRDFGPRPLPPMTAQAPIPSAGPGNRALSKDTVLNVRYKPSPSTPHNERLRSAARTSYPDPSPEHFDSTARAPSPLAHYSPQHASSPADRYASTTSTPPHLPPKLPLASGGGYPAYPHAHHASASSPGHASDALLARELSSIEISPSGGGHASARGATRTGQAAFQGYAREQPQSQPQHAGQVAFVPVRSHRERNSFY